LLAAVAWLQSGVTSGELKLPALFSDNMVLQRDQPVTVWGWADPNSDITVEFAGQKKTAKAEVEVRPLNRETGAADASASKGPPVARWRVRLDPMKACSDPQVMTVSSSTGSQRREIRNILVGDVWLCSGQSNMAMTVDGETAWLKVGGVMNAKEEVKNSANPLIRQFAVNWTTATRPKDACEGVWSIAGAEAGPKDRFPATANFTATGYFFARELQKRLGIPIALINSSFGGSSVENWISREMLLAEASPDYVEEMNRNLDNYENIDQHVAKYAQDLRAWEKKHGVEDPAGPPADSKAWTDAAVDTTDWKKVPLPANLARAGWPNGGIVWFRKEIDIPDEMGSAWRLDVPGIREFFTVYLNGVQVFEATPANGGGGKPSRPSFPRNVAHAGKNVIAIRLHAYTGAGGLAGGAFQVVPANPQLKSIPLSGEWSGKAEAEFNPLPKTADKPPVRPTAPPLHWIQIPAHFNSMIYPLIPYAIKGVTWYQGESNCGKTSRYQKHLSLLIKDWRTRWGAGDLPFYICQLPGYGAPNAEPKGSGWAEIREAQAAVAATVPHTGIANLIDTCEDGDLHPLNKQDAGYRLAMVALANTYGVRDLAWCGPVFESMKIEGNKAVVRFSHADGGLVAKELPATYKSNLRKPGGEEKPLVKPSPASQLQGFAVCGADRTWVWADAKIDGPTVVVWSDKVPAPVAVRYAWADHPVCNFYSKAGWPAFPFRTDDFPGSESGEKK
jgi:sialate O-acetylesterase